MPLIRSNFFLSIDIGDSYPKRYRCEAKFSCKELRRRGKCNAKWMSAGLTKWCLSTLTAWEKNQKIKSSHCRRTCLTCRAGKQRNSSSKRESSNDFGKARLMRISIAQKDFTEIVMRFS